MILFLPDSRFTRADVTTFDPTRVDEDLGKMAEGGRTDAEVVGREEEAIKVDSLSVAQLKEIRDKAEKQVFQVSSSSRSGSTLVAGWNHPPTQLPRRVSRWVI